MIERRHITRNKTYLFDTEKSMEYRRIEAGVSWPFSEDEGYIVVMAENYNPNPRLKKRDFRLLDEYSSQDAERLVKKLYDFKLHFLVDIFYSDTQNTLSAYFIDKFNATLAKTKKGIYLTEAPFADDTKNLRIYMHAIRNLLMPNKKSLFFGDNSMIPGAMSMILPDEVQRKSAQEFPMVAALGYVVMGMSEPFLDAEAERDIMKEFIERKTVEDL